MVASPYDLSLEQRAPRRVRQPSWLLFSQASSIYLHILVIPLCCLSNVETFQIAI